MGGAVAAILHAINWGVNAGDHIACNTSGARRTSAGRRPSLDGAVPGLSGARGPRAGNVARLPATICGTSSPGTPRSSRTRSRSGAHGAQPPAGRSDRPWVEAPAARSRVIDELGKLLAHLRAHFVVRPSHHPIGGREAAQIGNGLDIPDDDAGWHRSTTGATSWRFEINILRPSKLYLGSCRGATA
jgi:hypothetical protein